MVVLQIDRDTRPKMAGMARSFRQTVVLLLATLICCIGIPGASLFSVVEPIPQSAFMAVLKLDDE
jgi:hypothetical protein